MALLKEEAEKLSLGTMESGVIDTIITTDDLYAILPFKPIDGKQYNYNRESTLSEVDFVDVGDKINEGAATFDPQTATLNRMIGDVDVDEFLQETDSDVNNQTAIQITKKVKGCSNKFRRTLVNGNTAVNSKQFDGFLKLCPAGQKLDVAAGAALSYAALDWLIDTVKVKSGRRIFIMNSRTVRAYFALARTGGGQTAEMLNIPGVTGLLPGYRGFPIIVNDYVPITQDNTNANIHTCTTVTFLALDENEGFAGLTSKLGLGVRVVPIGRRQDKDAIGYRVKWYVSTILMSTLAIACATGITD